MGLHLVEQRRRLPSQTVLQQIQNYKLLMKMKRMTKGWTETRSLKLETMYDISIQSSFQFNFNFFQSYVKDLGRGQFGVVFKAKHNTSGIKVAIKEINTDQIGASTLPGIMVRVNLNNKFFSLS